MRTEPEHPTACLVVLAGAVGSADHDSVRALSAERRSVLGRNVTACVRRAVEASELPADTDPASMAAVFTGFLWGARSKAAMAPRRAASTPRSTT
ncbi:TetR family transcriptional regulator C-terminal domain-containing protein [Saccharopolyspora terrae]|uniref:TetR family transcriptional regulator C-terminal domain-containing protein n=1 Tax=Saccharopolyspora terrae TaxID=2530384 RepID=UPI0038B6995F